MIRILLILKLCLFTYTQDTNLKILNEKEGNIIEIPLIDVGGQRYKLKLLVGTPFQFLNNSFYDTQMFQSAIPGINCVSCFGNRFNEYKSSSPVTQDSDETLYYPVHDFSLKGKYLSDKLSLTEQNTTKSTIFILVDTLISSDTQIRLYTDGILGLGYNYDSIKYKNKSSILVSILQSYNITSRIIVQESRNGDGSLFIGGVPQRISNLTVNYSICQIPIYSSQWGCELSNVLLGKGVDLGESLKLLKTMVIFSTYELRIIAPENAFEYFNKFFINQTDCIIYKYNEKHKTFSCNPNFSLKIPLKIVINNFMYKLAEDDLFCIENSKKIFNIFFSNVDNKWTFGQIFLKDYQVVFNGDKGYVGFYGGYRIDLNSSMDIWIGIICGLIGFLTLIILICLVRKYKRDKCWNPEYYLQRNESLKI